MRRRARLGGTAAAQVRFVATGTHRGLRAREPGVILPVGRRAHRRRRLPDGRSRGVRRRRQTAALAPAAWCRCVGSARLCAPGRPRAAAHRRRRCAERHDPRPRGTRPGDVRPPVRVPTDAVVPADVQPLPDGELLVCDCFNDRIVRLSAAMPIKWSIEVTYSNALTHSVTKSIECPATVGRALCSDSSRPRRLPLLTVAQDR
jgi:hypothetical protein